MTNNNGSVPWIKNEKLAKELVETGWAYEDMVAGALRKAGLTEPDLVQPPKSFRAHVDDRAAYRNEVDMTYRGLRISVKSRQVAFTSPDDIPDKRNPLFVDTAAKWAIKDPTPFAVVCVSQFTQSMIWLPCDPMSTEQWGTREAYDYTRGYRDSFYTADRSLWQPFKTLPHRLKCAHDGQWSVIANDTTHIVRICGGDVIAGPSAWRDILGEPFPTMAKWLRDEYGDTVECTRI